MYNCLVHYDIHEVYDGHSHALLCFIGCCSSFWVDTVCYTDLVQNEMFLTIQKISHHPNTIKSISRYQKLLEISVRITFSANGWQVPLREIALNTHYCQCT